MDRRAFLKSVAGAGTLSAAGALATPAISQRATARTLRFVPQADLANFDPIWGTTYVVRNASAAVWDMLYGVDDKLQPQRQMVEAEEVPPDGLTWTFRLRPGLKFHDGEPVLAKDVVASLNRWASRESMGLMIKATSDDPKAADDIKAALAKLGYERVFLDFDKDTGIGAGQNWEKQLYEEPARCHAVVLVLTATWLAHLAIFFDILASTFILWTTMGKDIRRFYEPSMSKGDFETVLKYYLWGRRESYNIRQQMRERSVHESGSSVGFPPWIHVLAFAGLIVSAPQDILDCSLMCRELSIRAVVDANDAFDKRISNQFKTKTRVRQFVGALSDYLLAAGQLPQDFGKRARTYLFGF